MEVSNPTRVLICQNNYMMEFDDGMRAQCEQWLNRKSQTLNTHIVILYGAVLYRVPIKRHTNSFEAMLLLRPYLLAIASLLPFYLNHYQFINTSAVGDLESEQ